MAEFLKLTVLSLLAAAFVGTGLGFLVKLIVDHDASSGRVESLEEAVNRSLRELHEGKIIPIANLPDEIARRRKSTTTRSNG